jgi:DNA mismatch repair protein MutL
MKGRYPVCCLFLEIDPTAVDVNIHPSKREVKFHREFEIRKFVAQAVKETLLAFHSEPEKPKPIFTTKTPSSPSEKPATELSAPALPNFPEKLKPLPTVESQKPPTQQTPLKMGFSSTSAAATSPQSQIANPKSEISKSAPSAKSADVSPTPNSNLPSSAATPLLNVPLRLVGVVGRLYVLLESDRGLVLLDQHAAHEGFCSSRC